MAGPWRLTNTSSLGAAGSVSLTAPASAKAQGVQIRVRSVSISLAGTGAGTDTFQIKDGTTVIFAIQLSIAANGFASFSVVDDDIRITPGNTMTAAFAVGVASDGETVNVSGDFIPSGYPIYAS